MLDRPNILVITLDSLRPDHLGCYGYCGTETPHFDALAAQGVRFSNVYCQAPNTWMSHAALFTGCNPPRNAVRSPLGRLNSALPTLAERLQELGYSTFGMPSVSLLSREAGFARGFEVYHLEGLLSEFHGAVHFRELQQTIDLFREWLSGAAPPWLAWLHYFGIHVAQGELPDGRSAVLDVPESDLRRFSPFAQHYDAKIAYADRAFLGPVYDIARRHSDHDDLVIALLSDHGDDLRAIEAGLPGHDTHLGEATVRVPLVLYAPQRLQANTVVDSPVRLIDLYPTLLDLAGAGKPSPQHGAPPSSTIDGLSLIPLCRGVAETAPRPVYLENLYQGHLGLRTERHKLVLSRRTDPSFYHRHIEWRLRDLGTLLLPDRVLRPMRQARRLRRQRERFTASPAALCRLLLAPESRAGLFDLQDDPREQTDLAPEQPDLVAAMRETLQRLCAGAGGATASYTPEEQDQIHRRLSELGYF